MQTPNLRSAVCRLAIRPEPANLRSMLRFGRWDAQPATGILAGTGGAGAGLAPAPWPEECPPAPAWKATAERAGSGL